MARRGATAKVNLVNASTGPAAQLVTAKTGARQIAAAPLVHAPTPTAVRRSSNPSIGNPTLPKPVQVGGEKQHRQGFATQTATVGGNDYYLDSDGKNGHVLKDAAGNVVKSYTSAQMEGIARRGRAGATLDPLDSAAFFRFSGGKTERETALEDEQRKAANAAAADKAKQDYAHKLKMEEQQAQLDAQQKRTETAAAGRVDAAKIKAEADEKAKELARQAHERELGRAGDMTDEDFAEFQRMGGKQYATWGYSPENQAKIDSYEKEWQNMLESGNYSADDLQTMRGEIDARIGGVKKSVNKRTNTPDVDAQPILSQDGRFMWDSSKGANGAWIAAPKEEKPDNSKRDYIIKQLTEWRDGDGFRANEEEIRKKAAELGVTFDAISNSLNEKPVTPVVTNPADPSNLLGLLGLAPQPTVPTATPPDEKKPIGYNGKSYL